MQNVDSGNTGFIAFCRKGYYAGKLLGMSLVIVYSNLARLSVGKKLLVENEQYTLTFARQVW